MGWVSRARRQGTSGWPARRRPCWRPPRGSSPSTVSATRPPAPSWSPPVTTRAEWATSARLQPCAALRQSRPRRARPAGIGSTGGDRQANSALWRIVIVRMNSHPPTMAYVARRTEEGLSKKEIVRCLTRYVAREQFPLIQAITAPSGISSNGRARATRSLLDNKRRFTYAAMQVGQLLIRPPTGSDPAGLSVPTRSHS